MLPDSVLIVGGCIAIAWGVVEIIRYIDGN